MPKVFVKSFGCSANFAEGEMMAGILSSQSHEIAADENDAEIVVLNLCTVKGDHIALREVVRMKKLHPDKKVVVSGCITKELGERLKKLHPEASFFTTNAIHKVSEAVDAAVHSHPIEFFERSRVPKINLPHVRKNPVIGIVAIETGCLSACTFCSVKLIKGGLQSYPVENVVNEVKHCIADGCKEIWITGTDTACYGFDIGTNLARLLKAVVAVDGDFMVRVGMGNPMHVPRYLDELVEVFQHPKVFKFLHIPVQSGSDAVLKSMRRGHDAATFKRIVQRMREEIPGITISTDVIVGFPGETKEQFEETINLIRETKPEVLNISRFQSRKGTAAAAMPNYVSSNEKKRRSKIMTEVHQAVARDAMQKWIGWHGKILIDEHGRNSTMIGRNFAYVPVAVEGGCSLGDIVNVEVVGAGTHHLKAKMLNEVVVNA